MKGENVGLGGGFFTDFFAYHPKEDQWKRLSDFPGEGRYAAVGMEILNLGFVGTGLVEGYPSQEWWVYIPTHDTWKQLEDFPGDERQYAVGFSIGKKGYLGTGCYSNGAGYKDLWEYNPYHDRWKRLPDLPGSPRWGAVGFSIGDKGYIGLGGTTHGPLHDLWEFDPQTRQWKEMAPFPGIPCKHAGVMVINGKAYIGSGIGTGPAKPENMANFYSHEFWEFDPTTNQWREMSAYPGLGTSVGSTFVINDKGYLGLGINDTTWGAKFAYDFWEFQPPKEDCKDTLGPADYPQGACDRIVPEEELDQTASYVGGITNELVSKIVIPEVVACANEYEIEVSKLPFLVTIDQHGTPVEVEYVRSVPTILKERLDDKIKTAPGWKPATVKGKPVCSKLLVPIQCILLRK